MQQNRIRKTEDDRQAHRKMRATKRYKFHTMQKRMGFSGKN